MQISELLQQLQIYGRENSIPNISELNAQYIRKLMAQHGTKNLLEIGTANGYSAIQFCQDLQDKNGHITTIEFSQKAYEEAQENFELAGVSHMIRQYFGDAREIIPLLDTLYDTVFIDGLKRASLDFLKLVWEKTTDNALIIIDDVIKFRYKMEDLYTYVEEKSLNYEIVQTDRDDGIMVIRKNYQ